MARPQKEGIDYFSLDVDMDQDDKVALIEAKHKLPGFGLLVKLLMKIYKEGYYYRWTEREQLLFASKLNVDISFVLEVIKDCLKWEFFNEELFERYKILTSSGIQKRYLEAVKRRKDITMIENYILIDTEHYSKKYNLTIRLVNAYNNSVNVNNNSSQEQLMSTETPQSKVKKSKVKKSTLLPNSSSELEQIEKNKTTETVEVDATTENQTYVDESDSPKSEPHQPGFLLPTSDNMSAKTTIEPVVEKIILTPDEAEFMAVLETVKDYPLDRQKDIEYYHLLIERYPEVDALEAIKDWAIYKLGNPLKPKSNARSQINTSFQKCVEWRKHLKTSTPKGANNGRLLSGNTNQTPKPSKYAGIARTS